MNDVRCFNEIVLFSLRIGFRAKHKAEINAGAHIYRPAVGNRKIHCISHSESAEVHTIKIFGIKRVKVIRKRQTPHNLRRNPHRCLRQAAYRPQPRAYHNKYNTKVSHNNRLKDCMSHIRMKLSLHNVAPCATDICRAAPFSSHNLYNAVTLNNVDHIPRRHQKRIPTASQAVGIP